LQSGDGFRILLVLVLLRLLRADAASLDDEKIPPLRPPRELMPPDFWEQYGSWVIAGGFVLVVLVCGLIWLLTRPKPPVLMPPEVRARMDLGALRKQPETGVVLSRVSQVVRAYFSAAFALPPGELNTAEFRVALEAEKKVTPGLAGKVIGFLRECDQRKFGPSPPEVPLGAVEQAWRLIDEAEAHRAALRAAAAAQRQNSVKEPPVVVNTVRTGGGGP
jgi:hypothetical protein